jgi:hypothetical protein
MCALTRRRRSSVRQDSLLVRHGKASRVGPARRRTVLTVTEMDWVVDVIARYLFVTSGW